MGLLRHFDLARFANADCFLETGSENGFGIEHAMKYDNIKEIQIQSWYHYQIFYYFYPKRPLMLYSLKTEEQVEAWANIYSEMKNRWILSLSFGFFSYIFLSLALVK